jgi:sigma-B regulation protein RsbU (phosphoserine phosphatase)
MTTTPGEDVERLRRIEALFDGDLGHLDVEDLLDTLVERVRAVLDVDTAAVLLLERAGGQLVATAARGPERRADHHRA